MPEEITNRGTSLAYIVSQYPKLSEIFIIREVLQLRNLAFNIDVASVNAADRASNLLTSDEANESALTYYIKPDGLMGALRAHLKMLATNSVGYLRGLRMAFFLSGLDLKKLFFNLMYFTEALMTGSWMKAKGQTHLHAHLGSQPATIAMYVKKIFGFSYSITVHGPDEFYDAKGQYLAEKIRESDFICCISNFARSQLMKLSPYDCWHKLEVCRLGVDPGIFSPTEFEEEPAIFEVICVGRLSAAKGQHILIDAIAILVEKGRNVRLRIVGDGDDRDSLEKHAHKLNLTDKIIFEGAVNQDKIRELYSNAHIFSIPSFAEGIPVVLMEAMSMEIPCVTTRITGIPELIRDGNDGLLVAPSSAKELSAALEKLMDDAELRRLTGKNGRLRILEYYNLSTNVSQLGEVFKRRLG